MCPRNGMCLLVLFMKSIDVLPFILFLKLTFLIYSLKSSYMHTVYLDPIPTSLSTLTLPKVSPTLLPPNFLSCFI